MTGRGRGNGGRPRTAILGAGALGTTLGRALRRAGWPVAAVCRRDAARARAAARIVGGGARAFTDPARAVRGAGLLILAMRDREIAGAAAALAASGAATPGALAVHLSGAEPSSVLDPLRERGLRTASLHPLQTFAAPPSARGGGADLEGVRWFHEGDAPRECARIVRALRGRMRSIDAAVKPLYHAAAVAASNYLVVVEDLAVRLAEGAGIPRAEALRALLPLIRGTVENLERRGLPGALTGPVARGDAATVARHRRALRALDPELDALYAALGLHALRVAEEAGLPAAAVRRTRDALVRAPSRRPPPRGRPR